MTQCSTEHRRIDCKLILEKNDERNFDEVEESCGGRQISCRSLCAVNRQRLSLEMQTEYLQLAVAGVKQDHLCICSCELGYDGNVVILLNIMLDLS